MKLIAFRVTMYKGILDSGWVEVNPLTVLVGKNESGKTSLLRALYKLNPYNLESLDPHNSDSYNRAKEWPRAHLAEQDEGHAVCRAKFQLSGQEKSQLLEIIDRKKIPDFVEVSRNYAGQLEVNFEEDILSDKLLSSDIDSAFDILPAVQDEFGEQFKQRAEEYLAEARRFVDEGQFNKLTELAQNYETLLHEVLSPSDPPRQIEYEFINQCVNGLWELIQTLEQSTSIQSKVYEYITNHLPTFIYMSDYRAFSGTAQLDETAVRQNDNRLTEEDKTFLALLSLSNLDLDELVQLGQGDAETIKQRQYSLAGGAEILTRTISDRLRQRRYEVEYRTDIQHFFTYVKDDRDSSLIELEERSKGFQWFFSFDLMFMHKSEETFEGCVILLDEPGLHLHPEAQKDLLRRFEQYAKENTLLYTTHLPFMIDLNYPDRIRVLEETDNGIIVTTNFTESPPEAKLVLQAALGMNASQSFLVGDYNLVVEGVNDYWVLTELSNLLQRDGVEGLSEEVLITPGGSASEAVHIAAFMIGQKLGVVALFDSDNEGRGAADKLVKTWLTRYAESQTKVILLGEAVEASGDFALEDLFPEDFITEIVKEVYGKELTLQNVDEITLQGEDILWKRIERFMEEKGIEINKGPIATRLRKKLSSMKDASGLPEETRDKAIKLFQAIRSAFHEGGPQSS